MQKLAAFYIFLLTSLLAPSVMAANPRFAHDNNLKPLRSLLSLEEFKSLVQFNSGRVPEFANFWNAHGSSPRHQNVFWGGGILRAFLQWHFLQLQTHTIEELRQIPVPSIEKLQPLGGNDIDMFGPPTEFKNVEQDLLDIGHLDYISLDSIGEFVQLGGPTIEKVALNPFSIVDPIAGIQHYYEGRIFFHRGSEKIAAPHNLEFNDYSKTSEALRFIRFGHFNLPELTADTESVDYIQKISQSELKFVQRPDRSEWIGICLKKLFASSQGDTLKVYSLLHEYNLIPVIAATGIRVPSTQFRSVKQWLDTNQNNLRADEREAFRKMMPPSYFHGKISEICAKTLEGARSLRRRFSEY